MIQYDDVITYRIISLRNTVVARSTGELELFHQGDENRAQLHIGELLTNAAMASSTKRKVRAVSTLSDKTVTIINLLLVLVVLFSRSLVPTVRLPVQRIGEELL